jgi:hypothetical protein
VLFTKVLPFGSLIKKSSKKHIHFITALKIKISKMLSFATLLHTFVLVAMYVVEKKENKIQLDECLFVSDTNFVMDWLL